MRNGHTTSNRRRFHVDITSIHQGPNFDEFPVVSTYFFDVFSLLKKSRSFPRTIFDVILLIEMFRLFPRPFFDVISLVKNSTLFLLTFFDVILMVEECSLLARTYCDEIWTGRNMTSFLVKLQANKTLRRLSFVSNFKKMTFARFSSLDFSSKSPWCRPFSIKMWDLQLPKLEKEPPQVSFLGIYRTTTLPHNFWTATLLWSYSCKKV